MRYTRVKSTQIDVLFEDEVVVIIAVVVVVVAVLVCVFVLVSCFLLFFLVVLGLGATPPLSPSQFFLL